jgi:hypothetical protein
VDIISWAGVMSMNGEWGWMNMKEYFQ